MSQFFVLGWGSLLWDLENLAPHVAGAWQRRAGPVLPMEFTRVSPKRRMGLVVCLDARHGVGCATHAIASRRDRIEEVAADLAARERAADRHIGRVCLATDAAAGASAEVIDAVAAWCRATGRRGAVWTDLPSNFAEHLGEPFSVPRALSYLRGLAGENLDEAVRYIESAPAETDTPLRRHLATDPWWRAEAARVAGFSSATGAGAAPG
ncbi:hypothetical protein M1105_03425 [Limibaculum sp. FT325]|uniref:hypothetical protein n=1 Tax=Thermohalobaculum sediminis TaxID=2939436 RepID=UPI0020BED5FE|nr:hypothetical protein [Limibaculum sediminis]MCL5776050.1 hypothetical protein [Limibaculum sediminis]